MGCSVFDCSMEGSSFKGRIGTITDITEAKKHFPEDSGSG